MNKIKYRPHRGLLAESMELACEFNNYDELKQHVYDEWSYLKEIMNVEPFLLDDIVIGEPHGDDNRIGWKNVRYVCIKRLYNEDYMKLYGSPQCVGMCGE